MTVEELENKLENFILKETPDKETPEDNLKETLYLSLESEVKSKLKSAIQMQDIPDKHPKPFYKEKFISEAGKSWNLFYKRNSTNFFKDRHWVEREFPILASDGTAKVLLEVGCGVGNFAFPLLQSNKEMFIYCCDFAPHAIDLIWKSPLYNQDRIQAFVADLTIGNSLHDAENGLPENVQVDIISAMFCFSAIPPSKIMTAFENIARALKKGGTLIFRDYSVGDSAQLRFKPQNVMDLKQNFYVRQDSTFTLFFTPELVVECCQNVGLQVQSCENVEKVVVNRKQAKSMNRLFVQGIFTKI